MHTALRHAGEFDACVDADDLAIADVAIEAMGAGFVTEATVRRLDVSHSDHAAMPCDSMAETLEALAGVTVIDSQEAGK
jgi:hypothetical protein